MIVGFAGKKQSGKSTAASVLIDCGFQRYSFAQPLKDMADVLLGAVGLESADIQALYASKESIIEPVGVSLRGLLQTLGTEWGRQHVHEDVWVMCARAWFDRFAGFDFVIDDVRFENEAALIRELGGMVVHVTRLGNDAADEHASEAGVEIKRGDKVLANDDTEAVFVRMVKQWADMALAVADV